MLCSRCVCIHSPKISHPGSNDNTPFQWGFQPVQEPLLNVGVSFSISECFAATPPIFMMSDHRLRAQWNTRGGEQTFCCIKCKCL